MHMWEGHCICGHAQAYELKDALGKNAINRILERGHAMLARITRPSASDNVPRPSHAPGSSPRHRPSPAADAPSNPHEAGWGPEP